MSETQAPIENQPFLDLLSLVRPHEAMHVVDLGCGTGKLTQLLHQKLSAADTLGIDHSHEVLGQTLELQKGGLHFRFDDIQQFKPAPQSVDLFFSTGTLHSCSNHVDLLKRLREGLKPGGQIALSFPANHAHPTHSVAREIAAELPFRDLLGDPEPVPTPQFYAENLDRLGFTQQQVRLQIYPNRLPSRDALLAWVKTAVLAPYQARLPGDVFGDFVEEYHRRVLPLLEDRKPLFYPYGHLQIWGKRG